MRIKICDTVIKTKGLVRGQNQAKSVLAFRIDDTHGDSICTYRVDSGALTFLGRQFYFKVRLYRESVVKLRNFLNQVLRETRATGYENDVK